MAKLSAEKITEIVQQYKIDPVYSHVAKSLGVSPSTVKKYVLEAQENAEKAEYLQEPFNKNLIKPIEEIEIPNDFSIWTVFSPSEKKALGMRG